MAAYATAGAAAAFAAAPSADAAIVYSGPVSINVPATTSGVYLNLVTGAATTTPVTGWDFNPWGSTSLNFYFNTGGGGMTQNGTSFALLSNFDYIGPLFNFLGSTTSSTALAPYRAGETGGYLGIRFLNESTGATDYGWVQLTTTGATGYPATITGYAYENTGAALFAGAVPEPGTNAALALGALALGAVGVRRWRQSKAAAV